MGDINLPLPGFIALDWCLLTLALVFVLLRLWIRRTKQRELVSTALNVSDGATVGAWISGLVLVCINTWKNTERMHYISWPTEDLYYGVPEDKAGHLLLVSTVSLFFIYTSLWLSKAAMIAFYYHLFGDLGDWCTVVKAFAAVVTACTFVVHLGLLLFWCHPIDLNWDTHGHLCSAVHSMSSVTISTFCNVGTDLVIIILPIVLLKQLQVRRAQLYVYVFVLFMGSISIVAALARYGALKAVWGQPKAEVTHTIDVWAIVEIVASLLAVCLPTVRTLIMRIGGCAVDGNDRNALVPVDARRRRRSAGFFGLGAGDRNSGSEKAEEAV